MKSLLPISSLCKFIKRLILFGNVIKLFSLSSNVFKAESLPKFAGKYSIYASFIYNSLNPTICVIASGKRSNGLTLISIERRFLHSFILSGSSLIPKKNKYNNYKYIEHKQNPRIHSTLIHILFLLRSKYSKLINDAMAGGNVVTSLSLRESTRNSWH